MSLLHRRHVEPLARVGAARVAVCAAAIIVIQLIVLFLAHNTRSTPIPFLRLDFTTSLAVALLVAAVGGIVLTLHRLARRRHH
jgi:uncharacterized integral membrane protein